MVNNKEATTDDELIEASIRELFDEYKHEPLYYMREVGLQVRLKELIEAKLKIRDAPAQVERVGNGRAFSNGGAGKCNRIARVQLEIRIQAEKNERVPEDHSRSKNDPEICDLVLLREAAEAAPIKLRSFSNGPLDIVRMMVAADVSCAIELKATVSADKKMRGQFRDDVVKLLKLKAKPDHRHIQAHFILVDKSLSIDQHKWANEEADRSVDHWYTETESTSFTANQQSWWTTQERFELLECGGTDFSTAVHLWYLDRDLKLRHKMASNLRPAP